MHIFLLKLSCLLVCVMGKRTCSPDVPLPSKSVIPTYVVNLDLPPEQRWAQIAKDKMAETRKLVSDLKTLLGDHLVSVLDKIIPKLTQTLPSPYKEEIEGMSKATGIPLGEVTLYNIFYEVFSFCTSIIMENKKGNLFHVRNMDFGLFLGWDQHNNTWKIPEHLRSLVVNLDFRRNGTSIFQSTSFAGYLGVLTAMKPGHFSLTVNERFMPSGGYAGIIKWILGYRKQKWVSFLTRDVMENAVSYKDATQRLTNAKLLSPVYFVVGGVKSGQGCVITRGHKDVDTWCLGQKSKYQNSTWFVLETNYDHWKKPPFFDNRRDPAIHCLEAMSQDGISYEKVYQVLSTRPVLNKLTVYTTLMDVKSGKMGSWLRTCPDPCPIW